MTRFLYLCADDFGLSAAVNEGILALADQQRLSSVSCMSDCLLWPSQGPSLRLYRSRLAAGLHFNLTEPLRGPHWPLRQLIMLAHRRRLPLDDIEKSLHRQLDRFEAVWQAAPDFVDGHQHIQVLPGIRDRLLNVLQARYPESLPWLRDSRPARPLGSPKHLTLQLLARHFAGQARQRGFTLNQRLVGIYGLQPDHLYQMRLVKWLHQAHNGQLLMCHPAHSESNGNEEHHATRQQEFRQLSSPFFGSLLEQEGIRLRPFGARFHS